MAGNRKAAEASIIADVDEILPGSPNAAMYGEIFAKMSDKQFDDFVRGLEDGSIILSLIAPNLSKWRLSVARNLALAKKWGHKFFEKIWIKSADDRPAYLSNDLYLIIDWQLRRQAQLLTKKISIPEGFSVDDLTGQPTGRSKGSKLSYPETQILASMKMDNSIIEMIKIRGGDASSFNAMNSFIHRTGGVSQKAIEVYGGTVKSTETLHTLLTCMHLESTLLK
jgi:hypothetical protein